VEEECLQTLSGALASRVEEHSCKEASENHRKPQGIVSYSLAVACGPLRSLAVPSVVN